MKRLPIHKKLFALGGVLWFLTVVLATVAILMGEDKPAALAALYGISGLVIMIGGLLAYLGGDW